MQRWSTGLPQCQRKTSRHSFPAILSSQGEGEDVPIDNEDVVRLARMTNLESVVISGGEIARSGFRTLVSLRHLKSLTIYECKIDEEDLKLLATSPRLATLQFVDCGVSDAGAGYLASSKTIRELHLSGTAIGNHGLSRIASMRLVTLGLSDMNIDDRVGEHLARCRPFNVWIFQQPASAMHRCAGCRKCRI